MASVAPAPKLPDSFAARVAAAQQALAESIARAGLQKDPYRHVHEVMSSVVGLFPELVANLEAIRRPWSRDETRVLVRQLDQTLLHRWTQFNRGAIAIGIGIALAFGAACFGGGWLYGSSPVIAGVSAGAEQCHDQPDGSQICWIPIYKRLPTK